MGKFKKIGIVLTQKNYNGTRITKKIISLIYLDYCKIDLYEFYKQEMQDEIMGIKKG